MDVDGQPVDQMNPTEEAGSTKRIWQWLGLISVVAVIAIGVGIWFIFGRTPALGPTVGISGRSALDLKGLDQKITEDMGLCFTGYQVGGAGRNDKGEQLYDLTFVLKTDPKTDLDLIKELNEPACQTEHKTAYAKVTDKLGLAQSNQNLIVSYKSKSGQRLFIP